MTETSPDFRSLRVIGWPWPGPPEAAGWQAVFAAHPAARPARVIEQHRSGYVVADAPEASIKAESPPEWQRPPGFRKGHAPAHERAAVGDWVLMEGKRIVALLPRRTSVKRGAAGEHYQQQVIAANIDTVFIVCGLDADFNPRRIERYRLLVGSGGAEPVIVLTKADTGVDVEAAIQALVDLAAQQVAVRAVNARDADSVAALLPWLGEGRTVVLVGSSGAGKSTLTNTLFGEERMRTGAVRQTDSRGRHTTTYRALMTLPSGACVIDTPGMRELKPTGEEDLSDGGFADIEALATQCRFRDCSHQAEPGCAVRAAIERGELDPARLANYFKLRDEVAGAADKLASRLAQKAQQTRTPGKPPARRAPERNGRR